MNSLKETVFKKYISFFFRFMACLQINLDNCGIRPKKNNRRKGLKYSRCSSVENEFCHWKNSFLQRKPCSKLMFKMFNMYSDR